MRNVLNRKKNHVSDFSDFYFSSYGENSSKIDHIFSANMAVPLDPACFRIEETPELVSVNGIFRKNLFSLLHAWAHIYWNKKNYKSGKVHVRERWGMCWNEWKINFQIFAIISFWDMVIFVLKVSNFRWIFTITRKIKIGKILDMIFQSIQHISHLLCKDGYFKGGVGSAYP